MLSTTKTTKTASISMFEFLDLLETSDIITSVDLGSALVHQASHPQRGMMLLVQATTGECSCTSD